MPKFLLLNCVPGGGEGGVVLLAGEEGGDVGLGRAGVTGATELLGAGLLLLTSQVLRHLT